MTAVTTLRTASGGGLAQVGTMGGRLTVSMITVAIMAARAGPA